MTSVSAGELGNRIFELLAIRPDEPFNISRLRDGSVRLSKPDQGEQL